MQLINQINGNYVLKADVKRLLGEIALERIEETGYMETVYRGQTVRICAVYSIRDGKSDTGSKKAA